MGTGIKNYNDSFLWKLFLEKAKDKHKLIEKLTEFCDAAEDLSRRIVLFFPDFTIHDGKHLGGVCDWMYKLLQGQYEYVSLGEVVLLLMSACCHDLGMALEDGEDIELIDEAKSESDPEWMRYFERHPNDKRFIRDEHEQQRILRNYVRETHHLRSEKKIINLPWDDIFLAEFGISRELVSLICKSHGENLAHISYEDCTIDDIDPDFCAILLRLGDAMDYDANRAPKVLYRFLGLDDVDGAARKTSRTEWRKNFSGTFHRPQNNNKTMSYRAEDIPEPALLNEIDKYVSWVAEEIAACKKYIEDHNGRWKDHDPLPYYLNKNIKGKGFKSAEFKLRMDQTKVLELLSGEDLYSDPYVFVRELLQNSIDAIHARCDLDNSFKLSDGQIKIDEWSDGQYNWVRIEDNGTGMDERIINDFLLNIGRSYYSDESGFKKDLARQGKLNGYTPISRFGIGLLSCFMGGGYDNALEISTKYYSKGSKPIRISIPGMDGLYFLTELSSKEKGEPMPTPHGFETNEYLREPGTTICVRLNALSHESYLSKKALDKYICFPDVNIVYNSHTFTTQADFEKLVDSLNPDFEKSGIASLHIHSIPKEEIGKLIDEIPEIDWTRLPSLTLQYWPLGKMSESPYLSGVIVTYMLSHTSVPYCIDYNGMLFQGKCDVEVLYLGDSYSLHLEMDLDINRLKRFTENASAQTYHSLKARLEHIDAIIQGHYFDFELGKYEAMAHYAPPRTFNSHILNYSATIQNPIWSFNGINLIDNNLPICDEGSVSRAIILLSGDYRPRVPVTRNKLIDLPFAAACDLIIQLHRAGVSSLEIPCNTLFTAPLYEYQSLFKKHSSWTSVLEKEKWSSDGLHMSRQIDYLSLAYIKTKGFKIFPVSEEDTGISISLDANPDFNLYKDEVSFPPSLFLPNVFGSHCMGIVIHQHIKSYSNGEYNERIYNRFAYSPTGPFSNWLKTQREKLYDEVPSIYNVLINTVPTGNTKDIETRLKRALFGLQQFPGDPFCVSTIEWCFHPSPIIISLPEAYF